MGKRYSGNAVRSSGGDFPEGTYRGTIAEIQDSQNEDGTWGSTNFQMVNNVAVEAEREPGSRPHFVRITTYGTVQNAKGRDEQVMVADIDADDESINFGLRKAAGMWCQLAAAVGAATILDDGGVEFADSLEAFTEEFRGGAYEGTEVEFVVSHSISKKERAAAATEHRKPRPFVNTAFVMPEAGAETPATDGDETEETEAEEAEETEEEVPEEEAPTPAPRRAAGRTLQKAQARQTTTKASGAPKGSGKARFVRKGRK